MRKLLGILLLLACATATGQTRTAQDFGFRHLVCPFKSDHVDILIKSKKGEENQPKPLFFFCQGSLPIPLIIHEGESVYGTFPFNPDSLCSKYHLAIVGKPSVPLIAEAAGLQPNFTYLNESGNFPTGYIERNLLSYYVPRNLAVLRFLQQQAWVSRKALVLAGHSEGSTIAAKMATELKGVTHLIYSGGNPSGRILSIIEQARSRETDSTRFGEDNIAYWEEAVANREAVNSEHGDTYRATYEFSEPMMPHLLKLKIPILVTYGTKDWSSPYIDLLRVEVIRQGKRNFTFKPYIGTEHNFFPVTESGNPDYNVFNWDRVAGDWLRWLAEQ